MRTRSSLDNSPLTSSIDCEQILTHHERAGQPARDRAPALVPELTDLDKRKARLQLVGLVVVVVLATWFFFGFGMYSL
jgi:hypothetical protein